MKIRRLKESVLYLAVPVFAACTFVGSTSPVNKTAEKESTIARMETLKGWQKIADNPGDSVGSRIQCVGDRVCWLYDSKSLWRSDDEGRTWALVRTLGREEEQEDYYFANETAGWKISSSNLFRTMDEGRTWTRQRTPLDSLSGEIRSIWFTDQSTGWIAGGIYRPQTEVEVKSGVPNNTKDVTGKKVLEEAILRTDDGGETWNRQALSGSVGRILGMRFFDKDQGVAMGEVVYYTGDGGSHWRSAQFQKSCIGEKYLSDSYDARPAYAEMLNSKIWWISYDDGRLVRSVDGGHTWCDLLPPGGVAFYEAGHKYFMNLHFENPEHGWGLGWDRFLYETKDGGLSWTRITSQLTFDSMFFLNLRSGLLVSKTSIFRSEQ